MDIIIEFLFELIFDGTISLSQNRKVPRIIRYILIFIISTFILAVLLGILVVGILIIKDSFELGLFIILFDFILWVSFIRKIIRAYKYR